MKKFSIYGKIFGAILGGLLIAATLNKEIFVANTPQVRPHLGKYAAARFNAVTGEGRTLVDALGNKLPEQKLKDKSLVPLVQGVYAKTDENYSYTVVQEKDVKWIEYVFHINGKTIKIQVPDGQAAPTQQDVEELQ